VFGEIRVDDEGTETAAGAGAGVDGSAAPMPFLVDRPFAFTFSGRQTGTIHLLGTIHDPGVTAAAPKRTGVRARSAAAGGLLAHEMRWSARTCRWDTHGPAVNKSVALARLHHVAGAENEGDIGWASRIAKRSAGHLPDRGLFSGPL
jgi:hypothetical protein